MGELAELVLLESRLSSNSLWGRRFREPSSSPREPAQRAAEQAARSQRSEQLRAAACVSPSAGLPRPVLHWEEAGSIPWMGGKRATSRLILPGSFT